MEFLKLIPDKICCSPDRVVLMPGPTLICNACGKDLIGNVHQFINQPHPGDFFRSSQLAQAFADATGGDVPMSFPLIDIKGIRDTIVFGQSVSRVKKSIRLLRALNAPFTTRPCSGGELNSDDTADFMSDFLNIIHEHPEAKRSNERVLLDALLQNMHDMFKGREENPFNVYFTQLVPFVQNCLSFEWKPLDAAAEPEDVNLARELYRQLSMSYMIRSVHGRYVIFFEVLHIMVCMYACSSDINVVANWALDFLARICRGQFNCMRYADCKFVEILKRIIQREYSNTKNNAVVKHVINPIVRGESSEQWSEAWKPLHEMIGNVARKFFDVTKGVPGPVKELAVVLYVPAVLFRDHGDQLGFAMAYNHIRSNCGKNLEPYRKAVFKEGKRIHLLAREFVNKMNEFEKGKSGTTVWWDMNMVHLFLLSDPDFETQIVKVVRTLMMQDENDDEDE